MDVRALGKQSSNFLRFGDAFDAETQRGGSHGHFFFAGEGEGLGEGAFHDAEKFVHHFGFGPEEALEVLHPFEVGNNDAARVAEDVGNDEDFGALIEDEIGVGRGGTVGAFGKNAALNFWGVGGGDLAFEGGGNEDVAGGEEELFVGNWFGAGEASDHFVSGDVLIKGDEVQAGFVEDTPRDIANGDDFDAVAGQGMGGDGTDVAVALDDGGGFGGFEADGVARAVDEVSDAASGGFAAAK